MTSTNRFLNLRRIINLRYILIILVLLIPGIAFAETEFTIDSVSSPNICDSDMNFDASELTGYYVFMTSGTNDGKYFYIYDNTAEGCLNISLTSKHVYQEYEFTYAIQAGSPTHDHTTTTLHCVEKISNYGWWIAYNQNMTDCTGVEYWIKSDYTYNSYFKVSVNGDGSGGWTAVGTHANTDTYTKYTEDHASLDASCAIAFHTGAGGSTWRNYYFQNIVANFASVDISTFNEGDTFKIYDPSTDTFIDNPEPDYALDLSASGTFCYGHQISFNLSETTAQTYGMYDISLYLNGDAVSKYSETDFGNGPLLWSKTLEPGNWNALGWWVGGDHELTTWLNFTINQTCDASTFSGTINDSYVPGNVVVYDWEWNAYDYLNNLEPWEVPTFDNGNGTSLIDYMYSQGYINETEYNNLYDIVVIQMAQNNNLTNTTMQYTYGVLTPLVMINDSISTIRADVNSSYSVLNDAISPISTIFTWIFQIIPIAIIDLMSVILVFDAVRIVLAGRKN